MTLQLRSDGVLTLVTGASRSGKSSLVMLETCDALPLLVWDVEGQWSAMRQVRECTLPDLVDRTRARVFGRWCVTLEPTAANFSAFCSVAFAWAKLVPCATVVVEELADVTQPGKAPSEWGMLVRRGLKYGAHIWAITNAPAESDKTVIRNAGRKFCFQMELDRDREAMAAALDTDIARVAVLRPLDYLFRARGCEATAHTLAIDDLRRLQNSRPFDL